MIVLDKEYAPISVTEVRALIRDYKNEKFIPEIWDCDDIARDFVNYVKKQVKEVRSENAAFGMLVFWDHAQEVFVEKNKNISRRNVYTVRYMDHRDWSVYNPNERPKWIVI